MPKQCSTDNQTTMSTTSCPLLPPDPSPLSKGGKRGVVVPAGGERSRACEQTQSAGTAARPCFPRWSLVALVGITLLGAGIRLRFLDHPMRYDESYNYLHYASKSPGYIVTHYAPNNHILHTLMVYGSTRVFGTGPAALRVPAFLAGVALIPVTAWLGWMVSRRRDVALAAALAVCGSSALIEYSTNARGYSLLALFTVLCVGLTIGLCEEPTRRRRWLLVGGAAALGAYTVPVMVLPYAGIALVLLVVAIRAGRTARVGWLTMTATVGALTALLYLPVMMVSGASSLSGAGEMAYDVLGKQVSSFGDMAGGAWSLWCRHGGTALPVLVGLGLLYHLIAGVRLAVRGESPFEVCGTGFQPVKTRVENPWKMFRHTLPGTAKTLLPIIVVAVSMVAAAALRAPLPARTWLFALPLVLVCAVAGLLRWNGSGRLGTFKRSVGVLAATTLVLMPMLRVPLLTRLCSEPGGLVEVDEALEECQAFGIERCSVVAPYNPAMAYYMQQRGITAIPAADAPAVERVVIVATSFKPMSELWHSGVAGFEHFTPVVPAKVLSNGAVYFADRLDAATASR